ncbi:hypothetical protein INS49_013609 [Diaporthe citri]|uniref:uncharacterized protein n=1 Tax=Diaporthe citri TaxID=83186 RepID=UPI001C807751|nr:uncharacterized protein INS49_013609 [Diaporthe citri]KAG6357730.1 hypothetical protein INS49_013609 [Diaporthe citri]
MSLGYSSTAMAEFEVGHLKLDGVERIQSLVKTGQVRLVELVTDNRILSDLLWVEVTPPLTMGGFPKVDFKE